MNDENSKLKALKDFQSEWMENMKLIHSRNPALAPRTKIHMRREVRFYKRRAFIEWLQYRISLLLDKKAELDIESIEHKLNKQIQKSK